MKSLTHTELAALVQVMSRTSVAVSSSFPTINAGGCAIFASAVYKRLRDIVPCRLVVCMLNPPADVELPSVSSVQDDHSPASIAEWEENGVYFHHVMVEATIQGERIFYDATGAHALVDGRRLDNHFVPHDGEISVEALDALAASGQGWNKSFNREDIPLIKQKITRAFNEYIRKWQTPIKPKSRVNLNQLLSKQALLSGRYT